MTTKARSWKEAEDTALVQAWMSVAQDPITDNEQRSKHFWERVHAEFSTHLPRASSDVRKSDACKNQWQLLLKSASKFSSNWATIQRPNESGVTITQKLADTHSLYRENQGKAFKHIVCWELLRDCQKWKDRINPPQENLKRRRVSEGGDTNDSSMYECSDAEKRPIGRHGAKYQARQLDIVSSIAKSLSTSAKSSTKMATIAEKKVAALERLADAQKLAANNHIMCMDTSELDKAARRYYTLQKKRIWRELLQEERARCEQEDGSTLSIAITAGVARSLEDADEGAGEDAE